MNKIWIISGAIVAMVPVVWFAFLRGDGSNGDIEYRYEPVKSGELVRSISATGQVVALTSVDVKSKAGGIVEHLAVDEGRAVKKGDLIATIDPRDTKALYDQAFADLQQAQARASQAASNYGLQRSSTTLSATEAQANLETSRIRLAKAELEAKRQPQMTLASLRNAQAAYDSAKEDLAKFQSVTAPQLLRDAKGGEVRAKADFDAAEADYNRQRDLLAKGYVSQAVVDRARASLEAARSTYDNARQRASTIEKEVSAQRISFSLAVERADASLEQAKAASSDVAIAERNLEEARRSVRLAEASLQRAKDSRFTEYVRKEEVTAARAGTVRSGVALDNAKVQLESTTVVAPRDGVVTKKYLEEGTIIPPGTSLFAQGTSIVQLSDVSRLFVECLVDEADIAEVRVGQKVRIVTEAFPGEQLQGKVVRVNPAAQTEQNITAVKVRVEISPGFAIKVLPGMNATAEFVTLSKRNVLIVPGQAIQREAGKSFVKVKGKDPLKPETREVKLGESGNNGVEVLEGLKEGEEVVTAEINLAELRATQQKMQEALQGGGLAGGGPMGGQRRLTTGGGGAGGRGGGAGGTGGAGGGGRPGGGGVPRGGG